MRHLGKTAVLSMLLLFGAGCSDLEVTNQNEADTERALKTAGDIESLIAGSFRQWWFSSHADAGFTFPLSNMSWQHSQWPANFGTVFYSSIPRPQTVNDPADQFYGNLVYAWNQNYRALAAVADGFRALDEDPALQSELGEDDLLRARAFGRFVQGLGHASIALFYGQGFIIDETVQTRNPDGSPVILEPVSYTEMAAKAMEYFDQAIALSTGADFTIPANWMSVDVKADDLARIAHSMKARYRAAIARTPEERAAVDWAAVVADVDAGVQETWYMELPWFTDPWYSDIASYVGLSSWQQTSYQIVGMADQSGRYQKWINMAPGDRHPDLGSDDPFIIITPDQRFPQGSTFDEQLADAAERDSTGLGATLLYEVPTYDLASNWQRPDRGTMRWSYYRSRAMDSNINGDPMVAQIPLEEMRLLKAEALYRDNKLAEAATIINETRTKAGLNATDATGINTSCVPKLWDGTCGDLFEMLKWEKRLVTQFKSLHGAPWYFEGRGWGDLYVGTPLQLPVPCAEEQLFGNPCASFGGGGEMSAPVSVYAWPFEQ